MCEILPPPELLDVVSPEKASRPDPRVELPASVPGCSTVTGIMFAGEPCNAWDLPAKFGMTLEQIQKAREDKQKQRTFRTIGGVAFTLDEFEATQPFDLGQE